MYRDLIKLLLEWKNDPLRMPLILRGARQVGKSWLINEFANNFQWFIELNFDWDEQACTLFEGRLEIGQILEKIQFYTGKKIEPGKTLLFFDEVQECPRALKMLRYFKEKRPDLHVVAAGSLFDFMLEKVGVPVGRVQFLYLYPLSFGEFLTASGRSDLREYAKSGGTDQAIHKLLLEFLKTYMWLGGMPAVVDAWLKQQDPQKCLSLQDAIITAYQQDFLKYARKNQIDNVEKIFKSIPQQLGAKFKYSDVDQEIKSVSLKSALSLLIKAGVAYPCFHTSGQGLPLGANKNEKRFKVFFFDIGLAQRMLGLSLKGWVTMPVDVRHLGAIAEQLVAQEYVANSSVEKACELYYWHREGRAYNAEVDFLFVKESMIIPVEIKSGVKGGMKSMKVFLETHPNSKYGLKISQGLRHKGQDIQEISLYGLEYWLFCD